MSITPLVSIIIPTYNRADLISETLDSVAAQTYQNWECIIVDDGSTDSTDQVVGSFVNKDNRFKYYHRPDEHLPGGNGARNYGFKMSQGEYVNWFDSDDLLKPEYLEKKIIYSEFDGIISPMIKFNYTEGKKITFGKNKVKSSNFISDYLMGNITFYVGGGLWKKSIINNVNPIFDENISNMDDWDFNLRILYQMPKLKTLDSAYSEYRIHEDSLYMKLKIKLIQKEIFSDLDARLKHLKLLIHKDEVYFKILKKYTNQRFIRFIKMLHGKSKLKTIRLIFKYFKFKIKYNQTENLFYLVTYTLIYILTGKGYSFIK